MELMALSAPKNLIDLGQYSRNDVELITREYMRCAYLDTLDNFVKEYVEKPEEDETRQAILRTLECFEHLIAVLDQSEDFLLYVHRDDEEEVESEDEEFERF
jgi:hypothetical protein